ncbi:hypothetical protein CBR_g78029, partial [Chara braunii]
NGHLCGRFCRRHQDKEPLVFLSKKLGHRSS